MHQANWTDWAHLTSTDLVRWTRLKSALAPNGDWDGALTILADGKPVILFDCYNVPDCNGSYVPPPPGDDRARRSGRPVPNDHPLVGVAHPADLADPNLTDWRKDPRNPIRLFTPDGHPVTSGFAGPSNIFAAPDGLSFVMQYGRSIARLRSAEPSLHNWTLADPAFYPSGGHGGHGASGLAFYPLPTNVSDGGAPSGYNAWLGNLWPSTRGTPAGTQYSNGAMLEFGTCRSPLARCRLAPTERHHFALVPCSRRGPLRQWNVCADRAASAHGRERRRGLRHDAVQRRPLPAHRMVQLRCGLPDRPARAPI